MQEADVNGDGTIDYEEFLAATINRSKLEREELLKQVGGLKGGEQAACGGSEGRLGGRGKAE